MPNQQEMFGHNAMFSSVTFRSIMIEFSNVIYLAQIFSLYIYIYIYITDCRQYCFGLLGLISAVLMLGWR